MQTGLEAITIILAIYWQHPESPMHQVLCLNAAQQTMALPFAVIYLTLRFDVNGCIAAAFCAYWVNPWLLPLNASRMAKKVRLDRFSHTCLVAFPTKELRVAQHRCGVKESSYHLLLAHAYS